MQSQKNAQSVVLSCSHIEKKFELLEVLKDVDFRLFKGEKVGLVGPNGSGKSTLLKIIAGILKHENGIVTLSKGTKLEYFPQIHTGEENLSGGEMAKKVLAPIISSDANLFLLDEPTNNLDEDGLAMVEGFVKRSTKTFLIISHDRMFLDRVAEKIIEIDPVTKSSVVYDGNYSSYVEERHNRIERQWKEFSDKTEKLGKLEKATEQKLSWVKEIEKTRKNIKKLDMHEKEKPNAADLRDKEARASRRAVVMKRRFERFEKESEEIQKPKRLLPLHVEFEHERGSTSIFELKGVTKKIGKIELGPIDLHIQYGDRLHITGKNGSGKSTLIKILLGEIIPDSGICKRGANVNIGYVSQERWQDKTERTVIEDFLGVVKDCTETNARKILNRFRIGAEDVKKDVSQISPGEYSRLIIAELVAKKPNCIILDEPSNHLDLEVLEELENGLRDYKGTLIVVSHDRYFIENIKSKTVFDVGMFSRKI